MLLTLDAGEHPRESEALWIFFDLLSCACGGHAGDEVSMARVAGFCARSGVRLGAHPSYPDREGFGRRSPLGGDNPPELQTLAADVARSLGEQCRMLAAIARRHRVSVVAFKPHGALYHDAATHQELAAVAAQAAVDVFGTRVTIIGPPAGALRDEARRRGLTYAREGFADRRQQKDGSLLPRSAPNAVVSDPAEAAAQAAALREVVDTICVHADTPGVEAIARAVRSVLHG